MTSRTSDHNRTGALARLAGGLLLVALAAGCGSAPAATPSAAITLPGEKVTFTKVIEGDTLQLADGRRVRVLGIDSCDAKTLGGQKARVQAAEQLANPGSQPITLAREPGVDLDPTGMLLRYVQLNGADFGQRMVPYDHTGAFAGPTRMTASPEYLAVVRALDTRSSDSEPPTARDCGGPAPAFTRSGSSSSTTTTSPSSSSDDSSDGSSQDSSDDSSGGSSSRSGSSPTTTTRSSGDG